MFSKLSLSISAALLLSAFGGVVRAASVPAGSDISAAESGTSASTPRPPTTSKVSTLPRSAAKVVSGRKRKPDDAAMSPFSVPTIASE